MEIRENQVFRLSHRRSPKEVKLLNLEWAVITQLDGEKTVKQISEILALSDSETGEIFNKLYEEGLLDFVSKSTKEVYVSSELFKELKHELTLLVGPVADIIVNDVLKQMRRTSREFEKEKLPILIDLLANQIGDGYKKIVFQKNIYSKVREDLINI